MKGRLNWADAMPWLVLALGIGLTLTCYRYVSDEALRDARSNFEDACREAQRAIESRLTLYSGLLLGLRGLHEAQGGFNRRLFREYVNRLDLDNRYPAIQSLIFGREVTAAERSRFERDASAEPDSLVPFRILAPVRDRHHVLQYLEPRERYSGLIGRDLRSVRPEPDVFDQIRDSGEFVSTGKVIAGVAGAPLALRLAIFKPGQAVDSTERRRSAFIGSVGIAFSLEELLKETVSARTLHALRIRIHHVGRTGGSAPFSPLSDANMLIDSAGISPFFGREAGETQDVSDRRLSRERPLVLGGAMMRMSFSAPAKAYTSPVNRFLPALVLTIGLAISVLLFGAVRSLSQQRRRLSAAVQRRTQDLQTLNGLLQQEVDERNRLELAIFHLNVEERQRFGSELNENIGQQLTAVGFLLESLAGDLEGNWPAEHALASRLGEHVSTAIAHTRLLAQGLNPVAVEAGGFAAALQRLADQTRDTFRIDCAFAAVGETARRDPVLEHNLYRITQQAITNAITHGKATRVHIRLTHNERRLRLSIIDNGTGFAPTRARPSPGIGLQIMRYRCSVLGLRLQVQGTRPGGGAAVIVEQRSKD